MAQITSAPFVLRDLILTLGADQFEKHVSSAKFTPSASPQTWQGGTPDSQFTDTPVASWVVELNLAQDWETAGSLSQYLMDNEGVTVAASFKPRRGSGPSFTATVIITPAAIGGDVSSIQAATVTLGLRGRPVRVPAGSLALTLATPASGGIAGGTLVTISGTGLAGVTGAAGVKFGAVNATSYVVVSDTLIVAVTPAQAVGSKPATVGAATAPYTYV